MDELKPCPFCGREGEHHISMPFEDIGEEDWTSFQNGLSRVLRCFHRLNLNSLNMTLLLNLSPCADFRVQARITPRMSMPPWCTSDVNYFEKGHNEMTDEYQNAEA